SLPPVRSQGTIAVASPAKDDVGRVERMAASCGSRLSSGIARPPAITSAWLRATGTRPSEVTSHVTTARRVPGPGGPAFTLWARGGEPGLVLARKASRETTQSCGMRAQARNRRRGRAQADTGI